MSDLSDMVTGSVRPKPLEEATDISHWCTQEDLDLWVNRILDDGFLRSTGCVGCSIVHKNKEHDYHFTDGDYIMLVKGVRPVRGKGKLYTDHFTCKFVQYEDVERHLLWFLGYYYSRIPFTSDGRVNVERLSVRDCQELFCMMANLGG